MHCQRRSTPSSLALEHAAVHIAAHVTFWHPSAWIVAIERSCSTISQAALVSLQTLLRLQCKHGLRDSGSLLQLYQS